ncbi:MAG: choice-of-anchor D domain-containing protein, partial [Candidatus Cloacimonetes bacterium]|nr:choice-of-anchor D domain-containing protein [Candidatus Cloacimonadota bacterium]
STVLNFPIVVNSSASTGDNANFNLAMTGTGYSNNDTFGLAIGIVSEDFESGDFSGMSWYFNGNVNWLVTSTSPYEGAYSATNGDITDSQSSGLLIDMNVTSAGTISFYRSVSSESNYDYLNFYIDDTLQERWSGTVAWSQVSYAVSAGAHTFKWIYSKDSSVSTGSDCAWVDGIIFPPCTIVVPEPNIGVNPTSLDFGNVAVGTTAEETFTIINSGTGAMSGTIVTPEGYTVQEITTRSKEYTFERTERNTITYNIAGSSSKNFRVLFAPTALACYNFNITINSNDPDTPVYNLPVSGCGSTIEASVNPTSITGSLNIGQSTNRTLTLTNSGDMEMTYSVSIADVSRSAGGPDTFGYTWIDSNEPDGPDFNWITPNTTNEITGLTDDAAGTASPIGFSFPFYGTDYTSLYINANGMITFGAGSGSLSNTALPSNGTPNNMIAWFWDDMNPSSSNYTGHIYYQNGTVQGLNALIITFLDYIEYGGAATPANCVQAQVILFENGNIRIQYDYVGTSLDLTSETIGIENADGTDGLQVAYNTTGVNITNDYVVDFLIAETTPSWLTVSPTTGTVGANADTSLSVTLDATGLEAGTYSKNILIATNDPVEPVLAVPVTISVGLTGDPAISISTSTLSFGNVSVGSPSVLPFTITNTGGAVLTGNIVTPFAYTVALAARYELQTNPKESTTSMFSQSSLNERNSLGYSVNPGQTNTYNITFAPTAAITYSGNISITSNDPTHPSNYISVSGTGVLVDINVTPTSVSVESSIETTIDRTIQIANTGNAPLNYSINLTDPSRGSGGPDTFGYTWIDSNDPNGPTYAWVDIATTGTALTLSDDSYQQVTLPFTFNFYGNDYTSMFVNSNGFLSFGTGSTSYSDTTIPTTAVPNNMICPLWDDLKPAGTTWGNVYTQTVSGNYVVQFEAVSHYNSSTPTDPVTFEVILYPNGNIKFQYETIGTETDHHIGIENSDGTVGLQVAASGYATNGLAVDIIIASTTEWIVCDTASGTVNGGSSQNVTLTFDTNGLEYGTYQKNMVITSNDPDEATVTIPCTLVYSATQTPTISISDASFAFGSIAVGSSSTETLTITNVGGATLIGSISTPPGYIASLVTKQALRNTLNFNLTAGNSVMYDIIFTPTSASTYNGNIAINSNDASNPSQIVSVTGNGYIPADIAIDPSSFTFSVGTDATSTQNLTISNTGGQALSYTIAPEASSGVLLDENFDTGLPGDWQIVDAGTSTDTWQNIANYGGTNSIDGTSFMFVDSDAAGSGVTVDEQLITPTVSCSGVQALYLDFDHFFQFYSSGGAEKAEVDVWDGSTWQNVLSMTSANVGSWTTPDHQNIEITDYANSELRVRFHYYDADYDWFWAVDNVTITATGGSGSWLSLNGTDSVSGTIPASSINVVAFNVDTTGMTEGVYAKNVILTSNDPDENSLIIPVSLTVTGAENQPSWEDDVVIYPNNTATIYCEVSIDGIPASTGDLLGAFVNGECRGFGSITLITRDAAFATLVIQSAGSSETVYFQLYDASEDIVYDVETTCQITPGVVIGGAGVPQVINATTSIATPQDLQISVVGSTINLTWTAVPSATGYNVYSSSQPNIWTGITPVNVMTNSWSTTATEKLFFKVTAVKEAVTR